MHQTNPSGGLLNGPRRTVPSVSRSFYRRALPAVCVDFASAEGKALFKEALSSGQMEGFFGLAAQFHTQNEPAYCGLATLAMILNALEIDPQRVWKAPWRWFSEELLDCCKPLHIVQKEGITIPEFGCLARCNGALADITYASDSDVESFRRKIMEITKAERTYMVVSYDRRVLGQTGSGHFSPIAGYHPQRDLVLLMDVARFKYPPHWVPVSLLFEAMLPEDLVTRRSRAFVAMSANTAARHSFCRLVAGTDCWRDVVNLFYNDIPKALEATTAITPSLSVHDFVQRVFAYLNRAEKHLQKIFAAFPLEKEHMPVEQTQILEKLFDELHSLPLYAEVQSQLHQTDKDKEEGEKGEEEDKNGIVTFAKGSSVAAELLTIVLLCVLRCLASASSSSSLSQQLLELKASAQSLSLVEREVSYILSSLEAFQEFACCRFTAEGSTCKREERACK
ncbi:glutathione gamma-glutamylcysteinyltransferase [Balamuthia mandrillaris]